MQKVSDGGTPGSGANFFVVCTGQIEIGEFPGWDNLYCRYAFSFGSDWSMVHGMDTGLSQLARKGNGSEQCVVWNFPIEISFKSTNAFGWPRIAISVCALDSLGRDVVVGYGALLVPTAPGRYRRAVHLYAPLASSWMQRLWSWAAGSYPEFFDSKFVTRSEGREVTRVRRQGRVQVSLDVATRGMAAFGYDAGGWSGGAGASAIAQGQVLRLPGGGGSGGGGSGGLGATVGAGAPAFDQTSGGLGSSSLFANLVAANKNLI